MTRHGNYGGFFKERIEGIFLAGLKEISKPHCPELQDYIDEVKANKNSSEKAREIVKVAGKTAGFKITDERLNLTSNFV